MRPMLAKISSGLADAMSHFSGNHFLAEYKYDGVRAQVHVASDGQVSIFSRNCETKTSAFPDVASAVRDALAPDVNSIIIDAELVAVDTDNNNQLMAFQDLSHRPRSLVSEQDTRVPVCVFAFDILERNGKVLMKQPLEERREYLMESLVNMKPGSVEIAKSTKLSGGEKPGTRNSTSGVASAGPGDSLPCESSEGELRKLLLEALAQGAEGLMLKGLSSSSTYEPNKRSEQWIKLKADYCEGLHDSVDVVPIGAWRGNGRKVKWFSPFLLAIWDPVSEEFQSLCRCMSGFSDAFYKETTERLSHKILSEPKPYYRCEAHRMTVNGGVQSSNVFLDSA